MEQNRFPTCCSHQTPVLANFYHLKARDNWGNNYYENLNCTSNHQGIPLSNTTNYLPCNNSDRDILLHALPQVLQLLKVSLLSVHPLSRSCAYKKYRQTDGRTDGWFYILPPPPQKKLKNLFVGGIFYMIK